MARKSLLSRIASGTRVMAIFSKPACFAGALAILTCGGSADATEAHYRCRGGARLTARFSPPGVPNGRVELTFDTGRELILPQVLSADGGRYANAGIEFWIKGRGATLTMNGVRETCLTRRPGDDPRLAMREYPVSVVGFGLAAALMGLAASGANAASFNCQRARLPAEKAICRDANLSSLDERTTGMYFLIIGSGARAATVAEVKDAQSKFLASRNACGANIDCLVSAYTTEMMFLKNVKSNLGL